METNINNKNRSSRQFFTSLFMFIFLRELFLWTPFCPVLLHDRILVAIFFCRCHHFQTAFSLHLTLPRRLYCLLHTRIIDSRNPSSSYLLCLSNNSFSVYARTALQGSKMENETWNCWMVLRFAVDVVVVLFSRFALFVDVCRLYVVDARTLIQLPPIPLHRISPRSNSAHFSSAKFERK
jgi:hypothetical protein